MSPTHHRPEDFSHQRVAPEEWIRPPRTRGVPFGAGDAAAHCHTDSGFITVIYADQQGYKILDGDRWRPVNVPPRHFAVNLGDAAETRTKHLPRPAGAVIHRVPPRPAPTADGGRRTADGGRRTADGGRRTATAPTSSTPPACTETDSPHRLPDQWQAQGDPGGLRHGVAAVAVATAELCASADQWIEAKRRV
ncbi:2OG-Fe(II) oxygenase family protein [Streptomyces sp. NPDC048637]|uniref:2OG-Fe(II) oxygenase family protein n=1 Tax=Streptomyces sp. NPDC048637 TaxID=3155636 RepID=UPI00343D2FC9